MVPVFELVWSCAEILSMIGRRASFSDRKTILQKNSQRAKSSDNTRRGRNHFTFICLATPHPRRCLSWFLGATPFRMYSLFQINSKNFHPYLWQFPNSRELHFTREHMLVVKIFGTTHLAGWMSICLWLWKWGGGLGSFQQVVPYWSTVGNREVECAPCSKNGKKVVPLEQQTWFRVGQENPNPQGKRMAHFEPNVCSREKIRQDLILYCHCKILNVYIVIWYHVLCESSRHPDYWQISSSSCDNLLSTELLVVYERQKEGRK